MTRSHGRNISIHSLISSEGYTRVLDAETAVDIIFEHVLIFFAPYRISGPIIFLREQSNHYETKRLASLSSFVGASPLFLSLSI